MVVVVVEDVVEVVGEIEGEVVEVGGDEVLSDERLKVGLLLGRVTWVGSINVCVIMLVIRRLRSRLGDLDRSLCGIDAFMWTLLRGMYLRESCSIAVLRRLKFGFIRMRVVGWRRLHRILLRLITPRLLMMSRILCRECRGLSTVVGIMAIMVRVVRVSCRGMVILTARVVVLGV